MLHCPEKRRWNRSSWYKGVSNVCVTFKAVFERDIGAEAVVGIGDFAREVWGGDATKGGLLGGREKADVWTNWSVRANCSRFVLLIGRGILVTGVSHVMDRGRLYLILQGNWTLPTVLEGPPLIRGVSLFCGGWEGEGGSFPLSPITKEGFFPLLQWGSWLPLPPTAKERKKTSFVVGERGELPTHSKRGTHP